MPQAIPFVIAAAGFSTPYVIGASLLIGAYQQHRARSKQRAAAARAARQRQYQVRSGVEPRKYVLGTARLSGPTAHADFAGVSKAWLDQVVAIAHGRVQFQGFYLDDEYVPVGQIAANGVVLTGKFGHKAITREEQTFTVTAASTVTLSFDPYAPQPNLIALDSATPSGDWATGSQQIPATVSGRTVTFTGGPFTGTVTIRYNRSVLPTEVGDFAKGVTTRIQWKDGAADQASTVWDGLDTPKWTVDHRLRGVAHVRALFKVDADVFRGSTPNISVVASGPVGVVYDPRTASVWPGWTSNPALLAAWFRTLPRSEGGLGVPSDWIDWASVAEAANVCDELITVRKRDGSGYEQVKRYECHTVLSLDRAPEDNLAVILDAMAGDFPFTGGKYRCFAGAYRLPVHTITDDDVDAGSTIVLQPSSGSLESAPPNVITATIYDAAQGWNESGAGVVRNGTYVAADGSEEPIEIDLPATTDVRQANYLMGATLERLRPALAGSLTVKGKGADIALLDTLTLALTGYDAVASRVFEVRRRVNRWDGNYDLDLAEVRPSTWALDADRFTPVAPFTPGDTSQLWAVTPIAGLAAASGTAHLQRLADGTLITRALVSWTAHPQGYVTQRGTIELRWATPTGAWTTATVPGDAVQAYIGPLADGATYWVEARAVNSLGAASDWVAIAHQAQGKTEQPPSVAGLAATVQPGGVLVSWTPIDRALVPDFAATEVRYGPSWAAGTRIFRGDAAAFVWPWPAQGSYVLRAYHEDTSGNLSFNETTLALTVGDGILVGTPDTKPGLATQVVVAEPAGGAPVTITGQVGVPNTSYGSKWTPVCTVAFTPDVTGDALVSISGNAAHVGTGGVSTDEVFITLNAAIDFDADGVHEDGDLLSSFSIALPWDGSSTVEHATDMIGTRRVAVTAGTAYSWTLYAQKAEGASLTCTLHRAQVRVEIIKR